MVVTQARLPDCDGRAGGDQQVLVRQGREEGGRLDDLGLGLVAVVGERRLALGQNNLRQIVFALTAREVQDSCDTQYSFISFLCYVIFLNPLKTR